MNAHVFRPISKLFYGLFSVFETFKVDIGRFVQSIKKQIS